MNEHQTDSMHKAEQTPATQPADEADAAITDEDLDNVAGGGMGTRASVKCPSCGSKDYMVLGRAPNSSMQMKNKCLTCDEIWCG